VINGVGASLTVPNVWFVGSGNGGLNGIIAKTNASVIPYNWAAAIESFNYVSGKNTGYMAMGVSGSEDPFVVGYGVDSGGLSHAIIRSY
jgi:hypothetical protein